MKLHFAFPLLLALPLSSAISAEPKNSPQLSVLKSSAQSPHLTTRIQWNRFPRPAFKNEDLKDQNRNAIIRVYADTTGKVTKATVQESTGLEKLDEILLTAVRSATVKPYMDDDNALPVIGYQVFNLKVDQDNTEICDLSFDSKVWMAQQTDKKTAFRYRSQPQLELNSELLNKHDRTVKFSFKANRHGHVKSVKITQGSGIYALDQQVKQAVSTAQVDVPRKFWIYKKSKLKDEIRFSSSSCH